MNTVCTYYFIMMMYYIYILKNNIIRFSRSYTYTHASIYAHMYTPHASYIFIAPITRTGIQVILVHAPVELTIVIA